MVNGGGYIILLDGGYVSFPSPVMRKTLILSERGGREREGKGMGEEEEGRVTVRVFNIALLSS